MSVCTWVAVAKCSAMLLFTASSVFLPFNLRFVAEPAEVNASACARSVADGFFGAMARRNLRAGGLPRACNAMGKHPWHPPMRSAEAAVDKTMSATSARTPRRHPSATMNPCMHTHAHMKDAHSAFRAEVSDVTNRCECGGAVGLPQLPRLSTRAAAQSELAGQATGEAHSTSEQMWRHRRPWTPCHAYLAMRPEATAPNCNELDTQLSSILAETASQVCHQYSEYRERRQPRLSLSDSASRSLANLPPKPNLGRAARALELRLNCEELLERQHCGGDGAGPAEERRNEVRVAGEFLAVVLAIRSYDAWRDALLHIAWDAEDRQGLRLECTSLGSGLGLLAGASLGGGATSCTKVRCQLVWRRTLVHEAHTKPETQARKCGLRPTPQGSGGRTTQEDAPAPRQT